MVTTSDKKDKKDMVRFTAYLAVIELEALQKIADEHNTSVNYVIRNMIRASLGKGHSQDLLKLK